MLLISDPKVLKVPIQDNSEALIDLRELEELSIDPRKASVSRSVYCVRKSVSEKLLQVSKNLPNQYRLLIIEGHRPLTLQKEYFEEYSTELMGLHPDWDKDRVFEEASKYVAPPTTIPPHSTGGAIDLTLVNAQGVELDMGTRVNADPEESKNACFTEAKNISNAARSNRDMLIRAMTSAGFVNYSCEWWHWSYGDRYWAFVSQQLFAFYGSIDG